MRHNIISLRSIRRFVAATLVTATLMNPLAVNAASNNIVESGNAAVEAAAVEQPAAIEAEAAAAAEAVAAQTTEDGSIVDVAAAAAEQVSNTVMNAMGSLQAQFPEGLYWTNEMKYVSNCSINGARYTYTGYGCVAFALMASDIIYGSTNASYTKTAACAVSNIESGDIVRVPSATGGHTYVVISTDATGATIAEGNYNSSIHWGRHVSYEELANNIYVLSRQAA